jgi:chromate transport protein ChrA
VAVDLSLESRRPTPQLRRRVLGWETDRVRVAGVTLALVAIVVQVAAQIIDFTVYDLRIGALNSNVDSSVFGLLSLAAEIAMACAAAWRASESERRGRWLVLAALAAALVAVRAAFPGSAVTVAAPVAVVFVLVWSLTSNDPARARTVVRVALCLLAFSFVVHLVGLKIVNGLGYDGNSWPYQVKSLLKHGSELTGWILLATGILAGASAFSASARAGLRR